MESPTEIAMHFMEVLHRRDFDGLTARLHPTVRLRALQPGDAVVRVGASAVTNRFSGWFGPWDEVDPLRADAWNVGGRVALAYRLRLRAADTTREVEQHLYCDLAGEQIAIIDLLSSGFLLFRKGRGFL